MPRKRAPTACRLTVSGAISLPSRGAFHLSLTVLVHYRSPGSTQPQGVGPLDSHGIPRAPRYSGTPLAGRSAFTYRAITLYGYPFQGSSASRRLCDCVTEPPLRQAGPTTPTPKRRWAITRCGFRLVPVRSPLLGESRLLSSPRPTEMFQFGRFPPQAL